MTPPLPPMRESAARFRFRPYNVARWAVWTLYALVLLAAPRVFTSSL